MHGLNNIFIFLLPQGVLYLGPETIMPLASIIAAIVGFLLLFWRSIFKFIKKIFKKDNVPSEDITTYVEPDDEDIRPS